ncbi:MAG: sigma-70 family RNA polymerase sigma factor [Acidobacteriota bacterium]
MAASVGGRAASPHELVEHFYRHGSARLIAVLTRAFGVRYLDLIEDKVQEALGSAVESWGRGGAPANPSGWIYRVARNRVLDALRREKIHGRAMALSQQTEQGLTSLLDDWLLDEQVPDSLLRMIFVCAHPALDRRSQLALTLKILCGFSLAEVARGLLISEEAAKKRVQRAKKNLAARGVRTDLPPNAELESRLSTVHAVLYLLFNEGYSTSRGHEPLRDSMCEEATRLCHLLCEHELFSTPDTRALLALMVSHAARLDARVDDDGAAVLLADQDRSLWDRGLIDLARRWLERSKTDRPGVFHWQAAISLTHCRAARPEETDWRRIVTLYDRLIEREPSAVYALNRAVALGEAGDVTEALAALGSIRGAPEMRGYALLDCAEGRLHELRGDPAAARRAYRTALRTASAEHERAVIARRIAGLPG